MLELTPTIQVPYSLDWVANRKITGTFHWLDIEDCRNSPIMQRLGPCNRGPKVKKAKDPWRSDCNCKYSYPTIPQLGSSSGPTDRLSAKGYIYRVQTARYQLLQHTDGWRLVSHSFDRIWFATVGVRTPCPGCSMYSMIHDNPCIPRNLQAITNRKTEEEKEKEKTWNNRRDIEPFDVKLFLSLISFPPPTKYVI